MTSKEQESFASGQRAVDAAIANEPLIMVQGEEGPENDSSFIVVVG